MLKKHPGTPPDWVDRKLLDRLEKEGIPWDHWWIRELNKFAYKRTSRIHKPWKNFSWNNVDEMVREGAEMVRGDGYKPNKVVGLRPNVIGPGFAYYLDDLDYRDPKVVQDIDVNYASRNKAGRFINENLFFMLFRFPFKPKVIDGSGLDASADDKILLTDDDYATGKRLEVAKRYFKTDCENTGDIRSIVLFGSMWPTKEPKTDYIVDINREHGYAIYPWNKCNFVKIENSYQHK